jgi:alginate O-acetyltransferase complex protein AlgI
MRNFAYPYFSRDIAEFWRRWHISLSTWFRDYLYIPLGGSQGSIWTKIRNTFVIFLVSGFWHGANWTFVAWGFLNALYFLPLMLTNRNRTNLETIAKNKVLPSFIELGQMLSTFILTVFAWIFFRSENLKQAIEYISGIFSLSLFSKPVFQGSSASLIILFIVFVFLLIEWVGREDQFAIAKLGLSWKRGLRWSMYAMIIFVIGMFMQTKETPFIYFQF